jgi:hypothetical protein
MNTLRLWGLVLLLAASCKGAAPPPRLPFIPSSAPDELPAVEEFEPLLEQKGRLIDALFAIDRLVQPEVDQTSARERYADLLAKARPLAERAKATGGSQAAALEILGVLRADGFRYSAIEAENNRWSLQYGSITEGLRDRLGICLSFTLLTMAMLDACGIESWSACYPGHILVRVDLNGREIELESTTFGDPVAASYPPELTARSLEAGFLYTRSLDRAQTAWLYLTERLWEWVLRRAKDSHAFSLLARAEKQLPGTEESMCMQWAIRHHLRCGSRLLTKPEREEAYKAASEEFERLLRWDPQNPALYLLLSTLNEQYGKKRTALAILRRYMDLNRGEQTAFDVFVQARWWIKREEIPFEEYRPTPEEKRAGDAFLEKYFPSADRVRLLEAAYQRMLKGGRK